MRGMSFGAILFVLVGASAASGSPLRYDFIRIVTSITPGIEIPEGQVAVGESVSGSFTFPDFGSFDASRPPATPLPWQAEVDGLMPASPLFDSNAASSS